MGSRGPPPKSLSRLFQLKYLEGVRDRGKLAQLLGVKKESVARYERYLKKKLIRKLGKVSEDRLQYVCPECLEARVFRDEEIGERVCTNCGLVIEKSFSPLQRVPMNTTAAPTSYLGIGKSLGSEIGGGRRGLYQVLAKGPEGKKDLGLRAIHTRIITHTQEPPALEDLLKKGHNLSSSLGITDVMFNNTLGVNLRHAFYTINELKLKFYRREVVETAFYLTLCQHGEHTRAQILRKTKLKVNPKLLAILVKMDHFLRSLKDTEPLSPEVIELATKI